MQSYSSLIKILYSNYQRLKELISMITYKELDLLIIHKKVFIKAIR